VLAVAAAGSTRWQICNQTTQQRNTTPSPSSIPLQHGRVNRWQVSVYHKGASYFIGWFDNPILAARVYDHYALRFKGAAVLPKLNFPEEALRGLGWWPHIPPHYAEGDYAMADEYRAAKASGSMLPLPPTAVLPNPDLDSAARDAALEAIVDAHRDELGNKRRPRAVGAKAARPRASGRGAADEAGGDGEWHPSGGGGGGGGGGAGAAQSRAGRRRSSAARAQALMDDDASYEEEDFADSHPRPRPKRPRKSAAAAGGVPDDYHPGQTGYDPAAQLAGMEHDAYYGALSQGPVASQTYQHMLNAPGGYQFPASMLPPGSQQPMYAGLSGAPLPGGGGGGGMIMPGLPGLPGLFAPTGGAGAGGAFSHPGLGGRGGGGANVGAGAAPTATGMPSAGGASMAGAYLPALGGGSGGGGGSTGGYGGAGGGGGPLAGMLNPLAALTGGGGLGGMSGGMLFPTGGMVSGGTSGGGGLPAGTSAGGLTWQSAAGGGSGLVPAAGMDAGGGIASLASECARMQPVGDMRGGGGRGGGGPVRCLLHSLQSRSPTPLPRLGPGAPQA
jgi:hypothetical protein